MSRTRPPQNATAARNGREPRGSYATAARRWLALQRRDAGADGQFVYSVATTGVYCRPTCPSRLALRENVAFYDTGAEAERAGFRPCKRCRPEGVSQRQRQAEAIAKACRIIDGADSAPSLDALAKAVGLSRFHFQRLFKRLAGVTPRQYAAARRTGRVRSQLRTRPSVTEAIYGAGFSSSSRFYERSSDTLGMTPREYRSGGLGVPIRYAVAACPFGLVLVAGTARGICAVRFGNERATLERELRQDFPQATLAKGDKAFVDWVKTMVQLIKQPAGRIDLPLDIRGTAFQQRVWQALREIPAGQTVSYSEVAARIGQPAAVRAVARACAANPVAVIVPCHRVVKSDGELSGYRWGVERKRQLLKREQFQRGRRGTPA
ncbi:MAG TPA: bifunctional DNA-binding transcriptional regulator/O6-methylguanine-DNA methyltransferase Ada [Verrucomicrobiae bacterium]|jgi:AraC family transcriptional regulator of adaptative response/methylated-DNA-[protein]-cysteine methyltransferase